MLPKVYGNGCCRFFITLDAERALSVEHITFARMMAIACINLLGSLTMRMFYGYAFKYGNKKMLLADLLAVLKLFAGKKIVEEKTLDAIKISIVIIGAGRVVTSLADEFLNSAASACTPRCFVDVNKEKVGKDIHSIPVSHEDEGTLELLE